MGLEKLVEGGKLTPLLFEAPIDLVDQMFLA